MKKLILIALTVLSTLSLSAQRTGRPAHFRNVYTQIDSLVVENFPTVEQTEDGDYLIALPKSTKVVIAYNNDKTKAIVLHSGYQFVRHMEYNVKDDETRTVLYYKDKHLYCGYIYDKKYKAGKYFEAINEDEKDKLTEKLPFLKRLPTFKN